MRREMLACTAMAPGWAIPHARVAGLAQPSFALGRSLAGINWPGFEQVRLVFLFAVPEADCGSYLNLISGLARFSRDAVACQSLLDAPGSKAIFHILHRVALPRQQGAAAIV
jgi:mannitol/fructose-specific phosphotransferase system IIA component (Ntr-type)